MKQEQSQACRRWDTAWTEFGARLLENYPPSREADRIVHSVTEAKSKSNMFKRTFMDFLEKHVSFSDVPTPDAQFDVSDAFIRINNAERSLTWVADRNQVIGKGDRATVFAASVQMMETITSATASPPLDKKKKKKKTKKKKKSHKVRSQLQRDECKKMNSSANDSCGKAAVPAALISHPTSNKEISSVTSLPEPALASIRVLSFAVKVGREISTNELMLAVYAGAAGIGPRVFDVAYYNKETYIIMEHIQGVTLAQFMRNHNFANVSELPAPILRSIRKLRERLSLYHISYVDDWHESNIMLRQIGLKGTNSDNDNDKSKSKRLSSSKNSESEEEGDNSNKNETIEEEEAAPGRSKRTITNKANRQSIGNSITKETRSRASVKKMAAASVLPLPELSQQRTLAKSNKEPTKKEKKKKQDMMMMEYVAMAIDFEMAKLSFTMKPLAQTATGIELSDDTELQELAAVEETEAQLTEKHNKWFKTQRKKLSQKCDAAMAKVQRLQDKIDKQRGAFERRNTLEQLYDADVLSSSEEQWLADYELTKDRARTDDTPVTRALLVSIGSAKRRAKDACEALGTSTIKLDHDMAKRMQDLRNQIKAEKKQIHKAANSRYLLLRAKLGL